MAVQTEESQNEWIVELWLRRIMAGSRPEERDERAEGGCGALKADKHGL